MKENTKELFDFIDSAQQQMDELKEQFFQKWNAIIREHIEVDAEFQIEECADVCGGYWLKESSYDRMDAELKTFYDKRVTHKDGKIFLRGYDYYQIDPLMQRQKKLQSGNDLWELFQKKWSGYQKNISFEYLRSDSISIENWVGTLGLFEYLFTDLTALQWFAYKNKEHLLKEIKDEYFAAVREMETFVEIIGEAIACMLKFDLKRACILLSEKYVSIVASELLCKLASVKIELNDKASVRTVREGDSISLIYASYLMKLKPFCRQNRLKKIQLVSNAFGAMNTGIILKHLISSYSQADSYNILYAQNRAVEDAVYGGFSSETCTVMGENKKTVTEETQAVFVVDDSIFSGSSYAHIKKFLQQNCPVYLLPFTLNCDCIKYCRRGIKETDDMNEIASQVVTWAAEAGDILPVFGSFWDFSRQAAENKLVTDNEELRAVLSGDDLLTKHLWAIFEDEIFKEK